MRPQPIAVDSARPAGDSTARDKIVGREHLRTLMKIAFEHMRAVSEGLLSTNEELWNTNEELRNTNEELRNTNEELRNTNEELRNTNEELRNTNEELLCAQRELPRAHQQIAELNGELHLNSVELRRLSGALNSVFRDLDIAILLVDSKGRIRFYTPALEALFGLSGNEVGRALGEIVPKFDLPDWESLFGEVLGTLRSVDRKVQDRNGRCYTLRLRPYTTADHRLDGVLIVLLDSIRP